jgi:hypothetical protein
MGFFRMTTRRWMIAAAVAGAACWAYRFRERQRICRGAIEYHAVAAAIDLVEAESPQPKVVCGMYVLSLTGDERRRFLASLASPAKLRARYLGEAAFHTRVKQKFERAAWRVWEALPDDSADPPQSR